MFANRQVLSVSDADGLHPASLLPGEWADDEVAEDILVPIQLVLDIERQDRWTRSV